MSLRNPALDNLYNPSAGQDVDEIFNQLGYGQPQVPFGGSMQPQGSLLPPALAHNQGTSPQILKSKDDNFLSQFGKGLISPVTDTLSGFGVVNPREMPSGMPGIIGNMLGSVVGWTALTVFTAGIGTKVGLVGAGAAKIAGASAAVGKGIAGASKGLITQATGTTIAKGAAWGGLSQAHTWAFGQQEYENIPRELMIGAAMGGAFGAVGGKISQHLQKSKKLGATPRGIADKWLRDPKNMLTTDDGVTMTQALHASRTKDGNMLKDIMYRTGLDDVSSKAVKGTSKAFRDSLDVSKLNKRQANEIYKTLDMFDAATTKGDIDVGVKRLSGQLKRLAKTESNVTDDTYSSMHNLYNNLLKERDGFVTRALDADYGLKLAPLTAVQDPKAARFTMEQVKLRGKEYRQQYAKKLSDTHYQIEEIADYGTKLENFLTKVSKDTGVMYRPNPHNWKDNAFLVGKAGKYMDEWTDLVKGVGKGDITIIPGTAVPFGVRSPLKTPDLIKYMEELKTFPKNMAVGGISLHDTSILSSSVGYLATKLAPLRAIMGEPYFRPIRKASINHHRYVSAGKKELIDIANKYGWTSHKKRMAVGTDVAAVIERSFSGKATYGKLYDDNSVRVVQDIVNLKPGQATKSIKRMLKSDEVLNFTDDEASNFVKELYRVIKSDTNRNLLEKVAERGRIAKPDGTGLKTVHDLQADIASDFIHNAMLKRAVGATDAQLKSMAQGMGTDVVSLKAAADGRVLLDKLFRESDIDPAMYRAAYLPHYRQLEGANFKTALAEFKNIGMERKTMEKVFWANELSRQGDLVTYDNNFFSSVERYITGMSKKKHFEPIFKSINQAYKKLDIDDSRTQVYEQVKKHIQGIPSDMEKGFDGAFHNFAMFLGQDADTHATKTIGALLAELQYSSGMGFNPFMPIRNLTQKALGLSSLTESGNPIEGLYWLGKAKMAKAANTDEAARLLRLNDILTSRVYTESLDLQGLGIINSAKMMGMSDVAAAKLEKGAFKNAMAMFRWSDKSNVEDVFMAKAMYLQSKGFALPDMVEMARATTMASQFMYGIDSPMLYKNPIGKQIGIFQSWPLNWAQMLWEQGTQGNMHRAASTVVTMAVASELLTMTGISFRSIHPTETVQGILPLKMLEGERSWPLAFRSTAAVIDYMRSLADGDPASVDTALNNLIRSAEGLVPYGAVTNRTLRFLDRVRHDWHDYADTGFMHTNSLAPETRENKSRLVRILGETPEDARKEAYMGWLGTTSKSIQRMEDAEWVSKIENSYRRTRRIAIQAFIDGDYDQFQKKQEQLVVNFGQWIEPKDIKQEMSYMAMTARERQTRSLPKDLEEAFYEEIMDPRAQDFFY